MPPPKTPKKSTATEKKTAQTGLMPELDAPLPGYMTPKKKTGTEDDDLTDSPVRSVDVSMPTSEEAVIGSRQEEFDKSLRSAMGGKSRRKHKKSKKTRKTRKVKKHGKRRH